MKETLSQKFNDRISVTVQNQIIQALTDGNLVIPEHLIEQTSPWLPLLCSIQNIVKDRILVTSVLSSLDGMARAGSSHPNGWAIDITFPDRLVQGINPHFENDIYLLTYLASRLKGPLIIAAESDHLHLEVSTVMSGVFRYPTKRPTFYRNDKNRDPRTISDEQLWTVTPTSISLMPDQRLLVSQRKVTERVLPTEGLIRFVSEIQL